MAAITMSFLFIAYALFWVVPTALLVVILVRMNRLSDEITSLRRRLDGGAAARPATGQDRDLEGA